jgi:hypothetical protein
MSFGYDIPKGKCQFVKSGDTTVREIQEVRLYEISDTPFPMNPATRAAKSVVYDMMWAISAGQDITALLQAGQALGQDDLNQIVDSITKLFGLLNQTARIVRDREDSTRLVMSAQVEALQKAISGATWLNDGRGAETASEEISPSNQISVDLARVVKDARALLTAGVDFKAGRMISAANQDKIRGIIDAIEEQLEQLEELLGTAEPPADEESGKALTASQSLRTRIEIARRKAKMLE